MVGGASPAASAAARTAAAIEASAASLMRAALEAPSRWAVRVANQVPRASAFASRTRASASTRSNGGGILRRRSSPLALTVLTSNAQRQAPLDPAARAKPVMLFTAIRVAAPSWIGVINPVPLSER
jgi:hypothetical protein